jgi:hypothetical protein
MRRVLLGLGLAAVAVAAVALWRAQRGEPAEHAYVLTPKTAVWSRLAVVREPLAELQYGERLAVLERRAEHARVRTARGVTGWIELRHLMPEETWQRATALRDEAARLVVHARGATKVRTNVRLEPGRDGTLIFQFLPETKVEIVARRVAEWTQPARAAAGEPGEASEPPARREDWLLVRGIAGDNREVAGWVLGRFLTPDYPEALRDYAGAIRFVAWFPLAETPGETGPRPTWLAAGVSGPEGQACDFTLLRVYTWNAARARYETAFVESNLCGKLPLRVTPAARDDAQGRASFAFTAVGRRGEDEPREYTLRQNIVRRVRK